MKAEAKRVIAALEARGYVMKRKNTKGWLVYACRGHEILVNPSMREHDAVRTLKALGATMKHNKRSPEKVKARQADEREKAKAELDRLDKERAALLARRELSQAAAQRLAEIEREFRWWRSLMESTPASSAHRGRGRVKHQSGGRA